MAGHSVLSGDRAVRAIQMLHTVTDIFDAAGVRYWLDSGTLLGVVREQRLLPWDTDMDISISSDSVPKVVACTRELNHAGFRLRQRYHSESEGNFPPKSTRLFKVRNRKWLFFKGDLLLDIFVQHRLGEKYCWGLSRKSTELQLCVPATFFDTLEFVMFEGKRYPVPSDTEEYLRYRYGDWRVPVTQWNCFTDDRALKHG